MATLVNDTPGARFQGGFTLTEVAITVGVASFMMLVVMELMLVAAKQKSSAEAIADFNDLSYHIELALSNPTHCLANLSGVAFGLPNPAESAWVNGFHLNNDAHSVAQAGAQVQHFSVTDVRLQRLRQIEPNRYVGNIFLQAEKTGGLTRLFGSPVMTRNFPLVVESDAAGRITNCYSSPSINATLGQICLAMGGTIETDPVKACKIQSCEPGTVLVSFDANGNRVCQAITNSVQDLTRATLPYVVGSCPNGYALAGFLPNGSRVCR